MANSQTYVEGFGGSSQLTTLAEVQGAGLKLPVPTAEFINIRSPGKIERLFNVQGNSNTLYTTNKPQDLYLKGPLATANFEYRSIEQGQRNKLTTPFEASRRDARRVTKFLGSSAGTKFILKQLVLQGFQPHDETKVYNPASPIIAALRLASFGSLDRPVRHLDTSNIVGGLLGGTGLGSIVNTVGGLFGGGPAVPSPPRSSVASGASSGLGIATFTSMLGGADKSDRVVSPLARPDVRDLLRGQTATNAYNANRYSKLVGGGGGSFFGRLLSGAGKFLQNNTLIGGIIPPKQPWAANYRADEETYDLYLNAGKLFNPDQTGIGGGGILSGVLNAIGFGKKANYSQAARQRFFNKSKNSPNFNRSIVVGRRNRYASTVESTDETGNKSVDQSSQITTVKVSGKDGTLKYTDLIKVTDNENLEVSDQLLNYKTLVDKTKDFSDTFSDAQDQVVKNTVQSYIDALKNITGADPVTNASAQYKYNIGTSYVGEVVPSQFQKWVDKKDEIGFNYLKNVQSQKKSSANPTTDLTYEGRFNRSSVVPTRTRRQIQPTNNIDYVNNLEVLSEDEFKNVYSKDGDPFGPDIVKFYFYDIVNQKYIPFRATVKGIQDTNTADWETVESLGRPDKQYYYKGYTREVGFSFTVNAHSIKELMPMWQRINYLVGLTRPSNYTEVNSEGFMIPPMVQLTLGDFFKNHFVVIKSCNVTIPDDASWEVIPEQYTGNWSFGAGFGGAIRWGKDDSIKNGLDGRVSDKIKNGSQGRFAQFPRTAEINIQMSVMEKDKPKVGRAIWGDATVQVENRVEKFTSNGEEKESAVSVEILNKSSLVEENTFSKNIRYDTEYVQSS